VTSENSAPMSRRRLEQVPWRAAGRATERSRSADDVVRETGWVFNNETGERLTLDEFVATGDAEVGAYLAAFGLAGPHTGAETMVEIGSGIGRMTAGFTRTYLQVVACDLDAAFLERCRQTVARYGCVQNLRTSHVADGRTLALPDASADLVFSYITLQHCERDDALRLVREALRVARPGGSIALNFRTWTPFDVVLVPVGALMRLLWRVPRLGTWLAQQRLMTRLGWQANRLGPEEVFAAIGAARDELADVAVWQSPRRRPLRVGDVAIRTFDGMHPSHWWLVARRAD
jgi:SAM-dependent methyltransferase